MFIVPLERTGTPSVASSFTLFVLPFAAIAALICEIRARSAALAALVCCSNSQNAISSSSALTINRPPSSRLTSIVNSSSAFASITLVNPQDEPSPLSLCQRIISPPERFPERARARF
jgi:hypothetical protein